MKKWICMAQTNIGRMYREGKGVPQNNKKAVYWYRKAAEQGDAAAQVWLGALYAKGVEGVPVNHHESFEWYSKAAEQGYAEAQYNLGCSHEWELQEEHNKAVEWYSKAAVQGHADAQYSLGRLYYNGKVLGWYGASAVPQDYKKAFEWYSKAAEQGHADAQYYLGMIYAQGKGVPQDYVRAHVFLNIAVENGGLVAPESRDILAKKMTPSQIKEAQRLTREWMQKHQ